ncbi:MAG TPA: IS481 family transposase, partial [Candidatus Dormibacteraeota bacterium]|nr:IS481 family transposase [Candidatus Dormibacteraeota bacterium]
MGVERYVVEAVVREGLSHREVARSAGVSKAWVTKLVARYREGGEPALEPRSRRPASCPHAVASDVQMAILELRQQLASAGYDSGPHTIAHHLRLQQVEVPSVATIWRILKRQGLITPQPHKRPRCSFVRFEAALPNEMWQSDFTHWQLADGSGVEILNYLDDHSRLILACTVFTTVKGADVVESFHLAGTTHGYPAALLTDNGAVYSGKSRGGKVLLETELERLGIVFKHSTPYHPQTCGKVERFHQTLKRFLAKQTPPPTLAVLQLQLDTFRAYYNDHRPHRALGGQTPLTAFHARLKARPEGLDAAVHYRVRHDRVDQQGRVTLRYLSRLRHIGLGRAHAGVPVRLLVANKHVRVIREDGSLLRELDLDPGRDYQPQKPAQIGH